MSLSGFVRGGISVLAGLLGLYILENTFGTAMDTMFQSFHSVLNNIPLSVGWKAVGVYTLGGWVWFDKAFVVAVIALFVWLFSTIFIDMDYTRQQQRRY